jgi:transcriptional regulator with XRE-family HTH domain
MDKRTISDVFKNRLKLLMERRGETAAAFANRCNLDRSALSQFLDANIVRLPRAETLSAIAIAENVSVDWLLGVSQDEGTIGEVVSLLSVEEGPSGFHDSILATWHREASGYKIRYSPSSLPDLLRTKAVTEYEFKSSKDAYAHLKADVSEQQLNYSRLPETDMEVVMPFQRLENLAAGADIWSSLSRGIRQAQLEHIAHLIEELYPTFRLFLYDGRYHYAAPYTVFGPQRAAVYLGEMYMVVNSVDHIRDLIRRFDEVIRVCEVSPDKAAEWVRNLKVL